MDLGQALSPLAVVRGQALGQRPAVQGVEPVREARAEHDRPHSQEAGQVVVLALYVPQHEALHPEGGQAQDVLFYERRLARPGQGCQEHVGVGRHTPAEPLDGVRAERRAAEHVVADRRPGGRQGLGNEPGVDAGGRGRGGPPDGRLGKLAALPPSLTSHPWRGTARTGWRAGGASGRCPSSRARRPGAGRRQ